MVQSYGDEFHCRLYTYLFKLQYDIVQAWIGWFAGVLPHVPFILFSYTQIIARKSKRFTVY